MKAIPKMNVIITTTIIIIIINNNNSNITITNILTIKQKYNIINIINITKFKLDNETIDPKEKLGKTFMNKSSYVDILLENLGFSRQNSSYTLKTLNSIENNSNSNIPECIKKGSSIKSLGLNTSMESSKSVKIDKKSMSNMNPFTKYNSNVITIKKSLNQPIKITNTKKLNRDNINNRDLEVKNKYATSSKISLLI